MNISIGENYKITSDSMNVILNRKYEKKQGKEPLAESEKFDYKQIGYYPNLERACQALLNHDVMTADAENLAELMGVMTNCRDRITEAIREAGAIDKRHSESQ